MRIAVAGGTGTVGRHVVAHAQKAGHEVMKQGPLPAHPGERAMSRGGSGI